MIVSDGVVDCESSRERIDHEGLARISFTVDFVDMERNGGA